MMVIQETTIEEGVTNMQRFKRIITLTAITALTAASVPTIAAAATNTGSGSAKGGTSKQQVCDAMPGIVNTLGSIGGAMDLGSAAQRVVQHVQQALYDAAVKNCPA
jgi:hypothetical protein